MKRMGPTAPSAREALDLNIIVLVVSLAFVPLAFALLATLLHRDVHLGVGAVAKVVLGRALIPLLLGLGSAPIISPDGHVGVAAAHLAEEVLGALELGDVA
jgi:hypothetical protein